MARMDGSCDLTAKELAGCFTDPAWAAAFPPVLTVEQAAALVRVPKLTVYSWSSQGFLKGCSRRAGKHLRILRARFLQRIFNEGIHGD